MFAWLRNLASRLGTRRPAAPSKPDRPTPWTLRRWEAAETNRLNSAHWSTATGEPINQDLAAHLESLRTRSLYEASNNPIVEGVIETHAIDVVGTNGPTLQVQSKSKRFNKRLEEAVAKWWKSPDIAGQLSMPEILRLWIRQLWTCGEFLSLIVSNPDSPIAAQVGVQVVDPRRLATPIGAAGDPDITLGVRRKKNGRPTQYYITRSTRIGPYELETGEADPVPADMVLHGFKTIEAGQVRGVPWMATSLPAIADLRDYDAQVLDAARQAADQAVYLYTEHTDAPYVEANEQIDVERRTITNVPPGWRPFSLDPSQPSVVYVDYRAERLRELGRPVHMPLMHVRLDSSKHNYSSARYDGQVYLRGMESLQAWLEGFLVRIIAEIIRELQLAGELGPLPAGFKLIWIWPKQPHVDPRKEAEAEAIRLANGTLAYQDACAATNQDWETVIEKRAEAARRIREAELPPLPVPTGMPQSSGNDGWDDSASTSDGAGDAAGKGAAKKTRKQEPATSGKA